MEFKRLDKRKGSGAASIRSRYAYLIHLPDIDYFPPTDEKGVRLEGDIVLQEGRTMIPVYLTNPSQEYSYDTPGNDDEKTFLVKFVGTHPGTELQALEFSKNLLEEPFLIVIPGCEKNTPGKLLGQPNNPMIFTSTHKASKDGDKFNFNFEQRVGSEYIYFSYGGIINLPPSEDGPPSDPGTNNGFDPTKWARIDASNIDDHIAAWRAKLNIQQTEDRILTLGDITVTTTTLHLALHASGVNSVLLSGVVRSKNEDDDFTFASVTPGKLKYVLFYALNDANIFHIVEGVEGTEATFPDLPPGALLIKAVLISEFGALLEDADGGYKPLAEDPWRNIVISSNAATNVVMVSSPSCSFNVLVGAGSTAPKIAAIRTKVKKNTRDGQEITFYNDSDTPVALLPGDYEETLVYTTFPFEEAYVLKPRSFGKFKRKNNKYKLLPAGGGAEFPEGGVAGNVLEFDAVDGAKWSGRLTDAEDNIEYNAWSIGVLGDKITTEKNRNDTQDGQISANSNSISDLNVHQIKITTTVNITTNTVGSVTGKGQHGRNVKISNGVNAINLTCETSSPADFVASYTKLGSATITFIAGAGVVLVLVDGISTLSGAAGSTACLTREGNTYYLQISNR